jgi:hypothetical protein
MPPAAAPVYLRSMFERSRDSTSCGWQVFKATGAGLCFLVAALGVAGVLRGVVDALEEPRPLDWALVGTAIICLVILGSGAAFVMFGLRLAGDFIPPFASRPLRYGVMALIILVLTAMAIPLIAVTLLAWVIVATTGPVVDWLLTRRCVDCAARRSGAVGSDPVFCERHDRFFGGDAYRVLLSRDVDF